MLIRIPRGWELPESAVTPEAAVMGRRKGLGLIAGAAALGAFAGRAQAQGAPGAMAAPRNARFEPGRDITPERDATTYNNFYEFGGSKSIYPTAQKMPVRPWKVTFGGMVDNPATLDIEDILKRVTLEERVLRHRCVEAWAMTVPWTGFPLSELVKIAGPKPEAKYVVFETATLPAVMPGLRQSWYPWPYIEGCTVEEAANELAFVAVGMYGKPLPQQNGAPLRVLFPWKYGFKAGKSIVKVTLTDKRPSTFWEGLQASEYGFWANVNPEVPHPRWSQAHERLLGSGDRVPTKIFNGYGEFVASLYTNLQNERLWA
ncbi:protein-methionine-sulfoxide reductase catalytic subunit MsrP [Acetobacteraceae bacterium H6797]|nr:protein-methionine-sulfoxide reductase catalytic subunit MsrP [Acetobacteraceae bacterium H6797]